MRIGIVGGGAMGRWMARELSRLHEVKIYDVDPALSQVPSLEDLALWSDAVMVAVPFGEAPAVVEALAPYAGGRLIFDVATFKEGLLRAYSSLPPDARAATAHPMFGPGAPSLEGQRVLVMPLPGRGGAEEVARLFRELGARVEWGDVAEHDHYVSYTIGLSYAVGLALARLYAELGEKAFKYGGTSFRYLATYAFSLLNDKNALAYAGKAPLERFMEALGRVDVPKALMDPEEAYRAFYKALQAIEPSGAGSRTLERRCG